VPSARTTSDSTTRSDLFLLLPRGLAFFTKQIHFRERKRTQGCEEVNATGGLDYEETLALVQREQALRPAGKRLSPVDHELYQRAGLTPDWLIEAGCAVFDLKMPTLSQPRILGLLDPCTNNLIDPNIPAEIVYDRELDGLRLSNSWAGKYIILNPDFDQQVR
jgi:hypothetical protein